jgi:hypothetical protein
MALLQSIPIPTIAKNAKIGLKLTKIDKPSILSAKRTGRLISGFF